MIEVLVVDDDTRVARVNAAYVEKVPGFHVAGEAHSAAEALLRLETLPRVDLVLLDHYLPDETGLAVVQEMRRRGHQTDVIMVTAARDVGDGAGGHAPGRAAVPGEAVRLRRSAGQAGGVRRSAPHPGRRRRGRTGRRRPDLRRAVRAARSPACPRGTPPPPPNSYASR